MTGRRRHSNALSGIIVVLAVLAIGAWAVFPHRIHPYGRETYILVSDPVVVASRNTADNTLTLISFPLDIMAEGTHGYGTYSLTAFWRLGEIDKKDGTVLAESMSESLGIPVDGYIGPRSGEFTGTDALNTAKSTFSLRNIFGLLGGRFRTNISFGKFIALAWYLNVSRPDRVNTYDFSRDSSEVAADSVLPDGSSVKILDPQRVDAKLNTVFEDESVRRESVTVAVYNTTSMPSLGNRVGRLLSNLGVSVVTVGNDTPEVDSCSMQGNSAALTSKSAKIIEAVLGCTGTVVGETRADIVIRIGKSSAKRFLPN